MAPEAAVTSPMPAGSGGAAVGVRARSSSALGGAAAVRADRFAAGQVIAGRYRMISMIGRGGMGEVFRADDLVLSQQVALKFLPEAVSGDPRAVDRLLNEVRVARQVSHPNVCRVYDIGEVDGRYYLSMEFIPGEDLGSQLKRIGRLPHDKSVDLARQICTGLAAAHDRGVLHRDLKPSNILIDADGRARLLDFGLAGMAEELAREHGRAGTPAYMAPEQLLGDPPSIRTDIYALGLVLYELFTGVPAFRPQNYDELMRLHERDAPSASAAVPGLDPVVDEVITACLSRAPESRPASALHVAGALPGGDALAIARDAGVTPSPELVACCGNSTSLCGWRAGVAAALFALALLASVFLSAGVGLLRRVPLDLPPAVLMFKGEDVVAGLGYETKGAYRAGGFDVFEQYIGDLALRARGPADWDRLGLTRPAAIDFWYRQSPVPLLPWNGGGEVSYDDPPRMTPGMVNARLDPLGRLRELRVVPERRESSGPPDVAAMDWLPLLRAAGLDGAALTPIEPRETPPVYASHRAAWSGVYPESPGERIRVEAAAVAGKPVWFRIIEEEIGADARRDGAPTRAQHLANVIMISVQAVCIVGASVLAAWNLRRRRGDRLGATKVAVVMACLSLSSAWLMGYHPLALGAELELLARWCAQAVFTGLWFWVAYVALEPAVRRVWPETLLSWTRLLNGRVGDPMVGLSIVAGQVVGGLGAAAWFLERSVGLWMQSSGWSPATLEQHGVDVMASPRAALGGVLFEALEAGKFAMGFALALILLRLVLRGKWPALVVYVAIQAVAWSLVYAGTWMGWIVFAALGSAVAYSLVRYGLLSIIAGAFTYMILVDYPVALDGSRWWLPIGVLGLSAVCGLFLFGLAGSLGLMGRGGPRLVGA